MLRQMGQVRFIFTAMAVAALSVISASVSGQVIWEPIPIEAIERNRVESIMITRIEQVAPDVHMPIEVRKYTLDSLFRVIRSDVVSLDPYFSRVMFFYYNESSGITEVKWLWQDGYIESKTFDPESEENCFCPKFLSGGDVPSYFPNGLPEIEESGRFRTMYSYRFSE